MSIDDHIKNFTLANHPELIDEVVKALNIGPYFDWYKSNEESRPSTTAIYHGIDHTVSMALNAYEGALNSSIGNDRGALKDLVVAALFHDAGHLRGKSIADYENIKVALTSLQQAHDAIRISHPKKAISEESLQEVIRLIKATEYPYPKKKNTDILVCLLRDADMMTVYAADENVVLASMRGLYNEAIAKNKHFSKCFYPPHTVIANEEHFVELQEKFLNALSWHSRWGVMKAARLNWPAVVRKTVALLNDKL